METDVGFVCGRCDAYAPFETTVCPSCGADLGFARQGPSPGAGVPMPAADAPQPAIAKVLEKPPSVACRVRLPVGSVLTGALMEQARSYVCKKCYTPVPPGHKFCGRCGESVPRDVMTAQTLMISKALEPGKAKLVVIKGEGF